jgi:hypothetical protein
MPLTDRAPNLLGLLLAEPKLRQGNIFFVTHSFGGLIVEQVLRTAEGRKASEQNVAELLRRVRRVAFLGTPHLGADFATWGGRLRLVARPSAASKGLARNDPNLRDLNLWFRRYITDNGIETLSLSETRNTGWFGIVKPDSADLGVLSDPIPIDADHYSICSPLGRSSEVFVYVRDFLAAEVSTAHGDTLLAGAIERQRESIDAFAAQNATALGRIEEQLASGGLGNTELPKALVDAETMRRLADLRRVRFFGGSESNERASRLGNDLITGDLSATSKSPKSKVLAWCARLLMVRPDRSEALRLLASARALERNEEVTIAEAFQKLSGSRACDRRAIVPTPRPSSRTNIVGR